MAYDIIPSNNLQKILDMDDDIKQGKALVEYVTGLEEEIRTLKASIRKIKEKQQIDMIEDIMNKKPFKQWLEEHDRKLIEYENYDYSGMQGGF